MSSEYHNLGDKDKVEDVIEPSVVPEEVQNQETESDPVDEPEVSEEEDAILASDELPESEDEETESEPVKNTHRSAAAEKRIAKLVKEREQLKGQLALYQQSQQGQEQVQPVIEDLGLPNPENYPDGINDLDYKLDVREYQREKVKKDQAFKEQIKNAVSKYPDLPELIEADESRTNPTMVQLIKESEVAVDLFHYLLANPDVSNKIAAMSPAQSAREIGKIEAKLEAKAQIKKVEPPVKKALPPPITPVKPSKTANSVKQSKYTVY